MWSQDEGYYVLRVAIVPYLSGYDGQKYGNPPENRRCGCARAALLVKEERNHSDWAKHIKTLAYNPNMVIDLGERLYESVKDKYDLKNVTRDRASWYKSLIK